MVTTQGCRRQAAVDVDHVAVHRGRSTVVHHARIRRRAAQSTRSAMMIAGKGRIRMVSQAGAGVEPMMTMGGVQVVYRGRDRHRRWMMVSDGGGRASLIQGTGTRSVQRTRISMDMASETSCQTSMMMSLRVCVMYPGSVMMSNVRLCVAVMIMRVLSLVLLLKAYQALVQICIIPVIIVLVNVAVYVAMKMSMNPTFHRFVMMLVRIQHLLYILQLLLAGVLLLRRQAGVIFQLLI